MLRGYCLREVYAYVVQQTENAGIDLSGAVLNPKWVDQGDESSEETSLEPLSQMQATGELLESGVTLTEKGGLEYSSAALTPEVLERSEKRARYDCMEPAPQVEVKVSAGLELHEDIRRSGIDAARALNVKAHTLECMQNSLRFDIPRPATGLTSISLCSTCLGRGFALKTALLVNLALPLPVCVHGLATFYVVL
jgi:hypothetical protein